jgi:hypothetical protein
MGVSIRPVWFVGLLCGMSGFVLGSMSGPSPVTNVITPVLEWVEGDGKPLHIRLHESNDHIRGSNEAVNWFEAEHKAGLAWEIALGQLRQSPIGESNALVIELLCMDKPDGHFARIVINPKDGRIVDAQFGEYCW